MGRVTAEALIENLKDLWDVEEGRRTSDQVRRLSDSQRLGGHRREPIIDADEPDSSTRPESNRYEESDQQHRTRAGEVIGLVRLTVMGRDCRVDVLEVLDGVPVLIGQIPLENLDLVVNPCNHTLMGNPEHGGEHMYELY